jgi:hypothetical protein
MYKLISYFGEEPKTVRKYTSDDKTQWIDIPFNLDNTDYQAFKTDLANGATLQDATGTAMTASDITTFLGTLK